MLTVCTDLFINGVKSPLFHGLCLSNYGCWQHECADMKSTNAGDMKKVSNHVDNTKTHWACLLFDIGQVSMPKSSMYFKYFYILKNIYRFFPFCHKGEVHEKSLNIFPFSGNTKCVVSQKHVSKKIFYFSQMHIKDSLCHTYVLFTSGKCGGCGTPCFCCKL